MASAHAALQLAALGFFARHMNAGLSEWKAAGLATHQGSVAQGETTCECTRGAPRLAEASRPETTSDGTPRAQSGGAEVGGRRAPRADRAPARATDDDAAQQPNAPEPEDTTTDASESGADGGASRADGDDATKPEETPVSAKPGTARPASATTGESDAPPAYGPAKQPAEASSEQPPRASRSTSADSARPDAPQESAALQESFEEPQAPKQKAPGTRTRPPEVPPRRAPTNAPQSPGAASKS